MMWLCVWFLIIDFCFVLRMLNFIFIWLSKICYKTRKSDTTVFGMAILLKYRRAEESV